MNESLGINEAMINKVFIAGAAYGMAMMLKQNGFEGISVERLARELLKDVKYEKVEVEE